MSSVPLDPSATWIAVGNGPSAVSRELGALIDAHDCIVRFNRYETVGLESRVGSRCTHWATHGMAGGEGRTPMEPGRGAAPPRWAMMVHPGIPPRIEVEAAVSPPRELFADLRERIGALPSTGLATVYWLLRHVGVRRLHLVGFDGFSKVRSKAHHYWDPKAYRRPAEHDGDAELRLLRHWAAVGRVAFLS